MSSQKIDRLKNILGRIVPVAVLVIVVVSAVATYSLWLPPTQRFFAALQSDPDDAGDSAADDGHDYSQNPYGNNHDQENELDLSPTAWKNIGLTTDELTPSSYVKSVSVPAIVVERPGRSQINVTSPMTGVVIRVYPLEGESIQPGQALFDLRLTHEEVVTAQSEFLKSLAELTVAKRELKRLRDMDPNIIPGRRILDQEYEQDKLLAVIGAVKQSLLLHGMTQEQVDNIEQTGNVLRSITVRAPPFVTESEHADLEHFFHVQSIAVNRGENVAAGQPLAVLADHCLLYVEGQAFEDDARQLVTACKQGSQVTVVPQSVSRENRMTLEVLYVADHVDEESRMLKFYLQLPNELADGGSPATQEARRFAAWKYRPGQRMEVSIPTWESWTNQFVLPPDAVAIDGANAYVFEKHGTHFHRVDVHVLYRDKDAVVVEYTSELNGQTIATNGAYQMHLALVNQSGGAADPHAGHSH